MKKHIILFKQGSLFEPCTQQLWDIDTKERLYSVSDLSECPEDAIIGRDLFSGEEALDLIQIGMDFYKKGYTEIDFEIVECPEDLEEFIENYIKNGNINKSTNN